MNRYSILVVTLATLSFGIIGCSSETKKSPGEAKAQAFESLNEQVRSVITDPARTSEVLELMAQLEKSFIGLIEDRTRYRREFATLNADYDAPKEAFAALSEQIQIAEDDNRQEVAEIRSELIRVTTADEWAELAKTKEDAVKTAVKAFQTGT